MLATRALKGAACAAVVTATVSIVSPPADAALPDVTKADHVFILPGASADSWAPRILGRLDPWSTTNPRVLRIDENYYSCGSASPPCDLRLIAYPRTAGPLFGPNALYADESIAEGVDMTKEAIDPSDGPIVVAGLAGEHHGRRGSAESLDAGPPITRVTFIVSGDPSRVTPFSAGIGSFLPEGFRIPLLGWTVTRPEANSNYDTVVVVGEYDITADFPDRPWNVLALANSVIGFEYSHSPSALSSPTAVPEENIRVTTNDKGATTTTYLVPQPTLPLLRPFSGVAPRVISAANNILKPIVDRGYSRNDVKNGNLAPYLKPTDGLPQLVKPTRVTDSFKATPNTTALPHLDGAMKALRESRERSATPLQRLRHLIRNVHLQRDADPAAAEEAG